MLLKKDVDDDEDILFCNGCDLLIAGVPLIDDEGIRHFHDEECRTGWYSRHGQDQFGNDI